MTDLSRSVVVCDGLGLRETATGEGESPDQWPSSLSPSLQKSVLVLGLGNDILSDDAVGLHVTREVRDRLSPEDDIEAIETGEMGLSLLDFMVGYRDLVLVDSVQTGKAKPGHLHVFEGDALKILPRISPHFLGVGEILELGRQLGLSVPDRVRIFAIEVEDPFTLGEEMTPAVRGAQPLAVDRVLAAARALADG